MHPVKELLIKRNGLYCMLCGKKCEYHDINWHHIKPKYVSIRKGEKVDNSYENGSLLCVDCHSYVHTFTWKDDEYHDLMRVIQSHKKP